MTSMYKASKTTWMITEERNRWDRPETKICLSQNDSNGFAEARKNTDNDATKETSTCMEMDLSSSKLKDKGLRIMMLGCEDRPPYGPLDNTAKMFASLFTSTIIEKIKLDECRASDSENIYSPPTSVSIAIYNAKDLEYPLSKEEWEWYDGIIIPGSFSGAYEEHDWIVKLKDIIRTEIHPNRRRTLAVCFGHQVMAHAFQNYHDDEAEEAFAPDDEIRSSSSTISGLCVKCPHGHQAGRRTSRSTRAGSFIFSRHDSKRRHSSFTSRSSTSSNSNCNIFDSSNKFSLADSLTKDEIIFKRALAAYPVHDESEVADAELNLLYTHGDMVASLPPFALPLAATDKVSIVSSAYFATRQEAQRFLRESQSFQNNNNLHISGLAEANNTKSKSGTIPKDNHDGLSITLPYAITFQAHPEYVGSNQTFRNVVSTWKKLNMVPNNELLHAEEDAEQYTQLVWDDSVHVIMSVGTTLDWF